MKEKQTPDLFGSPDDESLIHEDLDEYMEEVLSMYAADATLPETITVCGYVRQKLEPTWIADMVLDPIIEWVDEEHGDPNESTKQTDGMKKAAKEFAEKFVKEYHVWSCDQVSTEEVNVAQWRKDNPE